MTSAPPRTTVAPARRGVLDTLLGALAAGFALLGRGIRRLREWNRRGGAGESGLAQLVEVHVLQTAGDATVAVALAGSLFFSVPTGEARSRVALFLLVTFVPFVVVAAVLGPLFDRFRRGRRAALAATMAARAVLAIGIGHSLGGGTAALTLYPAALGVLVASRGYTVVRSAAVPRLLPPGMSLVAANSRLTIAGVIAPAVAGAFAVAVRTTLGTNDELWLGAAVYVAGAIFALRLPKHADVPGGSAPEPGSAPAAGRRRGRFPPEVRRSLTSAAALRWLSGFALLYGAFVVREHPIGGLSPNLALGGLGAGLLIGNFLGTSVGSRVRRLRSPGVATVLLVTTTGVAALCAWRFGLLTAVVLTLVGAATAAMTKLALDSTIQEQVADAVRASTFGRSETLMQLAWALGGLVGILLPTDPAVGFSLAAAVLAAAAARALSSRHPGDR